MLFRSSRFNWIAKQINRPYSAFNNDDDFLHAPSVEKILCQLEENTDISGIYSWRNASSDYVSKRSKASSQGVSELSSSSRLSHCLDSQGNLPDAIWLSVQKSEVVKIALDCAYLSTVNNFENDRLSVNSLSIAFKIGRAHV